MATQNHTDIDNLRVRASHLGYLLLSDESDEKEPFKIAAPTEIVAVGDLDDMRDCIEGWEAARDTQEAQPNGHQAGDDDDKPRSLFPVRFIDDLNDRLRWAQGTIDMATEASEPESSEADALSSAYEQLRQARELVDKLDDLRKAVNGKSANGTGRTITSESYEPDTDETLKTAIAKKLLEYERHYEAKSLDEVIERLESHEWDVNEMPDGTYRAWHGAGWTDKGLAHLAALLEILEFCIEDKDRLDDD